MRAFPGFIAYSYREIKKGGHIAFKFIAFSPPLPSPGCVHDLSCGSQTCTFITISARLTARPNRACGCAKRRYIERSLERDKETRERKVSRPAIKRFFFFFRTLHNSAVARPLIYFTRFLQFASIISRALRSFNLFNTHRTQIKYHRYVCVCARALVRNVSRANAGKHDFTTPSGLPRARLCPNTERVARTRFLRD